MWQINDFKTDEVSTVYLFDTTEKAILEIKEILQLQYVLPKSRRVETEIIQPTEIQAQLLNMENLKIWVTHCTKQEVFRLLTGKSD